MTIGRPRRPLSREERSLWAEASRSVAPLAGRRRVEAEDPPASATAVPPSDGTVPSAAAPPPPRLPPPLVRLEPRMRRALARGRQRPDAVLDLHGLDQAAAHATLIRFLERARLSGHGLVQVVTGKGGPDGSGRGVLRRSVPHWLALATLRPLVLGWEEAPPHRGGVGALYVRLRRARG